MLNRQRRRTLPRPTAAPTATNSAYFNTHFLWRQGVATGRFFVEPVILTINYAKQVLGYKRVVMMGLSGGGWTTTMAAALDPRIELSIPVAGSIPCNFGPST